MTEHVNQFLTTIDSFNQHVVRALAGPVHLLVKVTEMEKVSCLYSPSLISCSILTALFTGNGVGSGEDPGQGGAYAYAGGHNGSSEGY